MLEAFRVIDADGHVIESSDGVDSHLQKKGLRPVFPTLGHPQNLPLFSKEGTFKRVSAQEWIEAMDKNGVDISVAFPTAGLTHGKMNNIPRSIDLTRGYNDWLTETYLAKTPRIQGVGIVPLRRPEAAALELRRVVNELGMPGITLPALGLPELLGAERFWPIYEEANRLGCAIAVHGGIHTGVGMDQEPSFYTFHSLGHPIAQMLTFMSLFNNDVFDRYPKVRFGFMEASISWLQLVMERVDESYDGFDEYNPERLNHFDENYRPSDHIKHLIKERRIFIGCGSEKALPYLVQNAGNCFMFSTDFPHEVTTEDCKNKIQEIWGNVDLKSEDKEAILHGNAEQFYKL